MEANYLKKIEYLWALLEDLNKEDKIELAARLMGSIRRNPSNSENEKEDWKDLYGAWKNEGESAEAVINFLKDSRSTNTRLA